MPAPTQIAGSPWLSSWSATTTPKLAPVATTFAVSTGDKVVVEAANENGIGTFGTPTNAAATSPATITWTLKQNLGTTNVDCRAAGWEGAVTAGGNVQVSLTAAGAVNWGMIVWAFSAHGGLGQTLGTTGTGTAPSATPASPWAANSFICCVNADFTAVSHGGTRSYLTNLGAATEDNYVALDGNYTTEAWHHADSGASPGSGAVGLSTPSQTWTLVAIEVLAATGVAAATPRRPQNLVPMHRASNW